MNAVGEPTITISLLLLEDDPVHRLLLEHEFQGDGYLVQSSGDASEAIRLIQQPNSSYDIGIFDLKVPATAGDFPQIEAALGVIRYARKAFPAMVVITISSVFITTEIQSQLEALGVKITFPKPFSLDKLHQFVDGCRL